MEITNELKVIAFLSELIRKTVHVRADTWDSNAFIVLLENTADKINKVYEFNKWIPISKGLPKKQGHYLIRCPQSFPKNYKGVIAEFYEDDNSFYGEDSESVHEDVTHWMQLPDADL